ncbi:helix-turn-helix domain-containing protein [Prescottella equi]
MTYLTIEEAAQRLGVSPATVRARCRAGSLSATKATGRWLVHVSALPASAEKPLADAPLGDRLDLDLALRQVELLDLVEEWVPDILRHEDQLTNRRNVLDGAGRRIATGTFDPPVRLKFQRRPSSHERGD